MDAFFGWVLAAGGGSLVLAGAVFGFAPVLVTKVLAAAFPKRDPRRAEMLAEIYKVPYKSRVTWLFEQFGRVLTEAVPARVKSHSRRKMGTLVLMVDGIESARVRFMVTAWGRRRYVGWEATGPRWLRGGRLSSIGLAGMADLLRSVVGRPVDRIFVPLATGDGGLLVELQSGDVHVDRFMVSAPREGGIQTVDASSVSVSFVMDP